MHIELEWEGPGSYFVIPAVVRSGEKWDNKPIHVRTTGDLESLLEEVRCWEESTGLDRVPIWREGGIIYRDDIKESDKDLLTDGPRL